MISTDLQRVQIQDVVSSQLPSYVRDDFPLVGEFLKQYYVSQEYPGASVDLLNNIDQYLKLESLTNNTDTTKTSAFLDIGDDTISIEFDLSNNVLGTYQFPDKNGLIQIDDEIILYTEKTPNSFTGCIRGFSGVTSYHNLDKTDKLTFTQSQQDSHISGSTVVNLSALLLNEFLLKIKKQFIPGFDQRDLFTNLNEKLFVSESSSFYKSKGTDRAFEILFGALYGETVEVIRPEEFLFKPSDAQYRVTKDLVVDFISATGTNLDSGVRTPLDLKNQTIFQDNFTNVAIGTTGIARADYGIEGASATIADVEKLFLGGKDYYKISLDFGYAKDTDRSGSILGDFSVHPKTKAVNEISIGATTIDVDSTIGFPDSGELVVGSGIVTYTEKTINQFLKVDGVTSTTSRESDIRINCTSYAYVGVGTTTRIDLRIGSVLSDVEINSPKTYYYADGDTARIKSLGITTSSPAAYSWIYNISPSFSVDATELIDDSNKSYRITCLAPHNFVIGTRVVVIAGNTELFANVNSVLNAKTFSATFGSVIPVGNTITVQRVTTNPNLKSSSVSKFGYIENYTSDVSNTYADFDGNLLVASSSLPYYSKNALQPITRQVDLSGSFDGDTFTFTNHGYFTGDSVYYKKNVTTSTVEGESVETISGFDNLSEGIYYIRRIDSDQFKISISQANLSGEKYVSVSGIVTSNTLIPADFYAKDIEHQKLFRRISKPVKESGTYITESGKTGILINGVEILNYKSGNYVYYGRLEDIIVSNSGDGYDVINPPTLVINDSVGTGATGDCNVKGSLKRIEVINGGFDYVEEPIITISGGNGIGAVAQINTNMIAHVESFNAADSVTIGISSNTIGFSTFHKFRNSEQIIYRTDNQTGIVGIVTDAKYYVRTVDSHTVSLHPTKDDAVLNTNTLDLTAIGTGIHRLEAVEKKRVISNITAVEPGSNYESKERTAGVSGINTALNYINIPNHKYTSGELVRYTFSDTQILGLNADTSYYVTVVDENNFALSSVGVGTTVKSLFYDTTQYINLNSVGSGNHTFNYEPISVSVQGKIGVSTFTGQNFEADVQPVFRGTIESVQVTDNGVGYGSSDIIDFDRQPLVTVFSGHNAELLPIVSNGRIQEVLVTKSGSGYNAPPDLIVSGSGKNATLVAVLNNGEISRVIVKNSGSDYTDDVSITIIPAGSGARFSSNLQKWNINLFQKYFDKLTDDDGILSLSQNENYGIQYSHIYAPRSIRESVFSKSQENAIRYGTADLIRLNNLEIESEYHSPIIGWAYDGNPIYGPYGYDTPTGGSVRSMKSGYELQTNLANRPDLFTDGFFVNDYVFLDNGDLDEHNGRFCITPDYPNGVYAYFATIDPTNLDSSGPFKGLRSPEFPYLIGNTYYSKPNSFNFEDNNQDNFDLNNYEYLRNTSPYQLDIAGTSYNYLFQPDSVKRQTININNTSKGTIQSIGIVTGGNGYQVGDKIEFETVNDYPTTPASAKVSRVGGKVVNSVSVASSSIDSLEIIPLRLDTANQYVAFSTATNLFSAADIVSIEGINTSSSYLKGSFAIGITSSLFKLTSGVGTAGATGIVTYFGISGEILTNIFNIRENDVYDIGSERIKILNVDALNSRVRVQRSVEGTVSVAHTATTQLVERTRKFRFSTSEKETSVKFELNKEIYFNPIEAVALGNESGVGIGTTLAFSNPGAGKTQLFVQTRAIFLPNHELNTGDILTYNSYDGSSIGVSTVGASNQFDIPEKVYVARISKDRIGLSTVTISLGSTGTFVGAATTTANDGLLYFTGIGTGQQHSFTTNKDNVVTASVKKNVVTVSTASTHGLSLGNNVYVNTISGVSTSVSVKYNDHNRRFVFDPKDFTAGNVDTAENSITIADHGLVTGDKVIHTASTPSDGLMDEKIYYVFAFTDDKIKLATTSYNVTKVDPTFVGITSASAGTISPINPHKTVFSNETVKFDLSDSSLSFSVSGVNYSAFDFNLYSDSDFSYEYDTSKSSDTFEVTKTGRVGVDTTAALTLKINSNVLTKLYYKATPVVEEFIPTTKKEIVVDDSVLNNNLIKIESSKYSGTHRIAGLTTNTFIYNTKQVPEIASYTSSNATLSYETDSSVAYGPISKIEFQNNGFGYPYIVGISSIVGVSTNPVRDGAILQPSSTEIGSIVSTTIEDIGFDYPTDNTLRPVLNLPEVVLVDPLVVFDEIGITSAGKNYTIAPNLVVLDGLTGKIIDDVDLTYEVGDTKVTILKNTKGISNVQPTIIPVDNSTGIPINSITYDDSDKTVTVGLATAFSDSAPLSVGDKILVEGVSVGVGTTGNGYNSSDYDYALFQLTDVNIPLGGSVGVVTYTMVDLLASGQIPGNFDVLNSSPRIIPEKDFPEFNAIIKKPTFLTGEVVTSGDKIGTVERWNAQVELLKINTKVDFQVGDKISGRTSKSQSIVKEVVNFNAQSRLDATSTVQKGWQKETGFLNFNTERIPDNNYYQQFSYSLKSKVSYETWNDAVSALAHPTGLLKFSDHVIETQDENFRGAFTKASGSTIDIITDVPAVIDVQCYSDFDLVTENALIIGTQTISDQIYFKSRILTDYFNSVGNRVLTIDDISPQFNNEPRVDRFSAIGKFSINQRVNKFFTFIKDRRFTDERQTMFVSVLQDGVRTFISQYGKVETSYDMGSFDFRTSGTEGELLFFPTKFSANNFNVSFVNIGLNNSIIGVGSTSLGDVARIETFQKENFSSETNIVSIASTYRSAHLIVEINNDEGVFEYDELNLIHDGTDAELIEYNQLTSNNYSNFGTVGLGTYECDISGGNLNVSFTPNAGTACTTQVFGIFLPTAAGGGIGNTIAIGNPDEGIGLIDSHQTTIASSGTPGIHTIATYTHTADNDYQAAYYVVSIEDTTNSQYQVSEVVVVNDSSDVYVTEYGNVTTVTGIGTIGALRTSTNTHLQFTPPASTATQVRVFQMAIEQVTPADFGNAALRLNNGIIEASYGTYTGTSANVLRAFTLRHRESEIFRRDVDASDTDIISLSEDSLVVPDHFFVSGEEILYSYVEASTPIGIENTTFPGIGATDFLPTHGVPLYAIKVNDSTIKIASSAENALASVAVPVGIITAGVSTAHAFTARNQNTKCLIALDNMIQSPIVATATTTGITSTFFTTEDIMKVSGITSFFGGDLIQIDNEIMKINTIGIGTTNAILVDRGWMGTTVAIHTENAIVTKVNGSYNIVDNTINFYTAPQGPTPIGTTTNSPDERDFTGITTFSTFQGRTFLRSGSVGGSTKTYDNNYVFDDISEGFNATTKEFTLKSNGENVTGFSTNNATVLISNIFQGPTGQLTSNQDYTLSEGSGISTITFTGAATSLASDPNNATIPVGGIIVSVGSTAGFGYQPLVAAGGTSLVSSAGTITSVSIGNSGSGYRVGVQTVHVGIQTFSTGLPNITGIGTAQIENGHITGVAVTNGQVFYITRDVSNVGYTSITGITTITTSSAHELNVGDEVILSGIALTCEYAPAVAISTVDYNNTAGIMTVTTSSAHGLVTTGKSSFVILSGIGMTCDLDAGVGVHTYPRTTDPYYTGSPVTAVNSTTEFVIPVGVSTVPTFHKTGGFVIPAIRAPRTANFSTSGTDPAAGGTPVTKVIDSTSFVVNSGVSTRGHLYARGGTVTKPLDIVFDDPVSYSNISLTGGGGTQAKANIVVGQGSSVVQFEFKNNGYGYGVGDVLTVPIGGMTGIPTDTTKTFEEFQITIGAIESDSFSAWHFGELQVLDLIQDQFDGVKRSFTLKTASAPVTIRSAPGSNIVVQDTLLVFLNDILQVPGEGYTLDGGSTLTFTSAPKGADTDYTGDTCKILFYKGSGDVDVVFRDILETVKDGDTLQIKDQEKRLVTEVFATDSVDTNAYNGFGIDSNPDNIRRVDWCKQKADKIIDGQVVSKSRKEVEPLVFPTTFLIQPVGVSSGIAFVESVKTFFDNDKENNTEARTKKITLTSQDNIVGASATAVVSIAGTISEIVVSYGGTGYTSAPTVIIADPVGFAYSAPKTTFVNGSDIPVGLGTTATATATLTGDAVSAITVTRAGTAYTSATPPDVIIKVANSLSEDNTTDSYSGDFGSIVGVTSTSVGVASTGYTFDFFIPIDSALRDIDIVGTAVTVSGIQTGYYFVVNNSNVGSGVTSLYQDNTVLGVTTQFLDSVYEVAAVSTATTAVAGVGITYVRRVTVSVQDLGDITGIGLTEFYGNYSWGRIDLGRRVDAQAFNSYTLNGSAGISTSAVITRSSPLKFQNYL